MTQDIQQIFQKAIGQTPDDMSVRDPNENARISSLGPVRNRVLDASGFLEHVGQRKPESVLNFFRSKFDLLVLGQEEGVSRDDERWARAGVADDIVELAKVLGVRQLDPDLLEGFTLRGAARRIVAALETTPRKRHVSRPRIALTLGPLDQEHFDRSHALPKHDRDSSVCFIEDVGLLWHVCAKFLSYEINLHLNQLSGPESIARASFYYSG